MNTEEGKGNELSTGQEGVQTQGSEGTTFDFSAFSDKTKAPEVANNGVPPIQNGEQAKTSDPGDAGSTQHSHDGDSDRNDDSFIWGDTVREAKPNNTNQTETVSTEKKEGTDEGRTLEQATGTEVLDISTEQFSVLSEQLGLEAKNTEELKNSLNEIVSENKRLKENYPKTNEKIGNYENLLNLDDKDLVRQNLIADGFDGNELENAIERYLDNDLIDIEAKKVRNTLNSAIDFEKKELMNEDKNEIAKQEQERQEGIKDLNTHLGSTDQMFGFKMATPDKLDNVRKQHQEYITSGTYLNELGYGRTETRL
jgi:hypothetical protein